MNSGIHRTSSVAIYMYAVSYVGLQPVDDRLSAERCSGNYITCSLNKTLTADYIIL